MIKITSKILSEIMLENFNKKVTYVGRELDANYRRIKPIKFAFFEWDDDGKMKTIVTIQELHILKLIKKRDEELHRNRYRAKGRASAIEQQQPIAGL